MRSFHILTPCQRMSLGHGVTYPASEGRAGAALLGGEGRQPANVTHTSLRDDPTPPCKDILWPSWHPASLRSLRESSLIDDMGMSPGYRYTWQAVSGHRFLRKGKEGEMRDQTLWDIFTSRDYSV